MNKFSIWEDRGRRHSAASSTLNLERCHISSENSPYLHLLPQGIYAGMEEGRGRAAYLFHILKYPAKPQSINLSATAHPDIRETSDL